MIVKAPQLRAAIDSANPAIRLYLLHGPDESEAGEWAARLARAMGPDAERVDLDGAVLKGDPGRLAAEAASMSLFGTTRHIRVTQVGEESLEALTLLLNADRAGNPVVALGTGLKTSGKVVKLANTSAAVHSFACYPMNSSDADRLASAIASEHGMRTVGQSARRLVLASGGDRAILTREIEKIALYLDTAPERPGTLDDAAIDAIGADLGEAEISRAVEAVIGGEPRQLGNELARLWEAGVSPIPVLRALVRRLMVIAELQAEVMAGAQIEDTIERHRIFFREKPATARALRVWSPPRLSRAIDRVREAERAIMGSNNAGKVIAESVCLIIARAGKAV